MKVYLFVVVNLFSLFLNAQTTDLLHEKKKIADRITRYIDPKNGLTNYYAFSDKGFSVYANAKDKLTNKPEFFITWEQLPAWKNCLKTVPGDSLLELYKRKSICINEVSGNNSTPIPQKPLTGIKIAIDPGHIAGDTKMASIEYKTLRLKADPAKGLKEDIELIEGNLTLATALILKDSLEAKGATVMLTRDEQNETALGIKYDDWVKQSTKETFEQAVREGDIKVDAKNRFILKKNSKDIFQNYFKTYDLKRRAFVINQFVPDITIVIHYNVDETNTNWTSPTNKNFNMTFVPGNIKAEYLNKITNRFEFMRLALTDDLDKSIALGKYVIDGYKVNLNVPIATKQDAKYLREECYSTKEQGVFVRNLVLTRLIHGPMIYGETLYQDNIEECKMLNDCTINVNGIMTSNRVKQVANAYYQGILQYYSNETR